MYTEKVAATRQCSTAITSTTCTTSTGTPSMRATTTSTGTLEGRSVDTEVTDSQLLPRVLRGAVVADRFAVALSGVAVAVVDQKAGRAGELVGLFGHDPH